MKPVKSTAEILAFKALNRDIDKTWVDWAVDMLMAGFDTDHLRILAGESEPFNQFQMQEVAEKVLEELRLDYSDKDQTIKNYACYLIDKSLDGELDNFKVLDILKDICIELDYEKYLNDFYSLYFAKDDLSYSENQLYWDGATRENIEKIITDYFRNWKTNCLTDERTIGDAFDIEKQISQNWNLFLYDLAVQKLAGLGIKNKEYNDKVFGSWFIERQDKRLVYDGKDSWLIFQTKTKDDWTDIEIIKKDELKYSNFVRQMNRLTENTTQRNKQSKSAT